MSTAHEEEALVTGKRKRMPSRKALENMQQKKEGLDIEGEKDDGAEEVQQTAPVKRARASKRKGESTHIPLPAAEIAESASASAPSAGPDPGKAGISKDSTSTETKGVSDTTNELQGDACSSTASTGSRSTASSTKSSKKASKKSRSKGSSTRKRSPSATSRKRAPSKSKSKKKDTTKAISQLEDPFTRFSGFFFESLFPFLDLASVVNLSHCNTALQGKVQAMLSLSAQTVYGSLQSAPAPSDEGASGAPAAGASSSSPTVEKELVTIAAARKGWSKAYQQFCLGQLFDINLGSNHVKNWGCFVRFRDLEEALEQRGLELRDDSHFCRVYIEEPAGEGNVPLMQVVATMWLTSRLFRISHRAWSNFHDTAEAKMHKFASAKKGRSAGDWMLSAERAWDAVSTRARRYESAAQDRYERYASRRYDRYERYGYNDGCYGYGGDYDYDDGGDDDSDDYSYGRRRYY